MIFQAPRSEMEEHSLKLTNVHTQLLLQMQNEMNLQMVNEKLQTQNELQSTKTTLITIQNELESTKTTLQTTQNELQATKTILQTTQNELQATKTILQTTQNELQATTTILQTTKHELQATTMKLEQLQNELKLANEESVKKEKQIAFLQDYNQKQIEQGIKLNQKATETFANYYIIQSKSTYHKLTLETIFKSLESKEPFPNKIEPVKMEALEPFDINGTKLEFPILNQLIERLTKPFKINYEKSFDELLKKMENGKIYNINNDQLVFKLHLPKNHLKFYINHITNIAQLVTSYANNTITHNDHLVVLDNASNNNGYEIYLQIPNYDNNYSKAYMYPKNEAGDKLLLKYTLNDNVNIDAFKNGSDKILFMITKQ